MKPTSRDLFEIYAATELGHTSQYIREHRAPSADKYYSDYIQPLYRAWKMAWQTANEYRDGQWDGRPLKEIK